MANIDFSNHVIISYLGGTFGNSLASVIHASMYNQTVKPPKKNHYHSTKWPIEVNSCMPTKDSEVKLKRQLQSFDIVQIHCLNAELVFNKFKSNKCIQLFCNREEEYFAIQRQWKVLHDPIDVTIENINSAWDWIHFNLTYYNKEGRVFFHSGVLSLEFKSVEHNFNFIEQHLNIRITDNSREIYKNHLKKQLETFYEKNANFELAWRVYTDQGPDAPIVDIAKDYCKSRTRN